MPAAWPLQCPPEVCTHLLRVQHIDVPRVTHGLSALFVENFVQASHALGGGGY